MILAWVPVSMQSVARLFQTASFTFVASAHGDVMLARLPSGQFFGAFSKLAARLFSKRLAKHLRCLDVCRSQAPGSRQGELEDAARLKQLVANKGH